MFRLTGRCFDGSLTSEEIYIISYILRKAQKWRLDTSVEMIAAGVGLVPTTGGNNISTRIRVIIKKFEQQGLWKVRRSTTSTMMRITIKEDDPLIKGKDGVLIQERTFDKIVAIKIPRYKDWVYLTYVVSLFVGSGNWRQIHPVVSLIEPRISARSVQTCISKLKGIIKEEKELNKFGFYW